MPREAIVIGVPAYRAPDQVTFARLLVMPFRHRPAYRRPPDDRHPDRAALGDPPAPCRMNRDDATVVEGHETELTCRNE